MTTSAPQQGIDWDYGLRPLQQYLREHTPHMQPPAGLNSERLYAWLPQILQGYWGMGTLRP